MSGICGLYVYSFILNSAHLLSIDYISNNFNLSRFWRYKQNHMFNSITIHESDARNPNTSYKGLPIFVASRLISVTPFSFASSIRISTIFLEMPLLL